MLRGNRRNLLTRPTRQQRKTAGGGPAQGRASELTMRTGLVPRCCARVSEKLLDAGYVEADWISSQSRLLSRASDRLKFILAAALVSCFAAYAGKGGSTTAQRYTPTGRLMADRVSARRPVSMRTEDAPDRPFSQERGFQLLRFQICAGP